MLLHLQLAILQVLPCCCSIAVWHGMSMKMQVKTRAAHMFAVHANDLAQEAFVPLVPLMKYYMSGCWSEMYCTIYLLHATHNVGTTS